MIAVIMPYQDREMQLRRTLASMERSSVQDWAVVLVHEGAPLRLQNTRVHQVTMERAHGVATMQDISCNAGFNYALRQLKADTIMIQHAECFHYGDVFRYVQDNLTDHDYITFGCYSIDKDNTLKDNPDMESIIAADNHCVNGDLTNGWYNHPHFRNAGYEFCAAITAGNMVRLNGYDERFAMGIAHNDNYLIWRIRMMGLNVRITDSPIVVHQWHTVHQNHRNIKLWNKNAELFNQLKTENRYRAKHTITEDLKI
jgi:hypothetical protein